MIVNRTELSWDEYEEKEKEGIIFYMLIGLDKEKALNCIRNELNLKYYVLMGG